MTMKWNENENVITVHQLQHKSNSNQKQFLPRAKRGTLFRVRLGGGRGGGLDMTEWISSNGAAKLKYAHAVPECVPQAAGAGTRELEGVRVGAEPGVAAVMPEGGEKIVWRASAAPPDSGGQMRERRRASWWGSGTRGYGNGMMVPKHIWATASVSRPSAGKGGGPNCVDCTCSPGGSRARYNPKRSAGFRRPTAQAVARVPEPSHGDGCHVGAPARTPALMSHGDAGAMTMPLRARSPYAHGPPHRSAGSGSWGGGGGVLVGGANRFRRLRRP